MSNSASGGGGVKRVRRPAKKAAVAKTEATPLTSTEAAGEQAAETGGQQTYFWSNPQAWFGVSRRDITIFLRQMIMLLEAGTPLLRSLHTLSERSERAGIRALIADIAQYVEMGNPLWQAFERNRRYFDPVFVNLVKASEASGTLVTVLARLVEYRERRQRFIRRVQSAMIYPVVVFIACLAVVLLIGKFVLPEFRNVFDKLEQEVPKFTQNFMDFVDMITDGRFLVTVAVVVIALVLIYKLLVRNPLRRLRADRIKLFIPYIGPNILRKSAVVDMTRTMSLLLSSGLSMMVTLELTRNAIRNRAVAQVMQDVRDAIEKGEGIEQPMREASGLIPPVVTDMLVTGEESGQMDRIAGQIASAYEEEVDIHINTLSELLPPALALVMGAFVLVLALAVFVPLIQMLDQLQGAGQ